MVTTRAGSALYLMVFATLATTSSAFSVSAEDRTPRQDPPREMLRIPGLPPVPMPPGAHVYGQGGPDLNEPDAGRQDPRRQGLGRQGEIQRRAYPNGTSEFPSTVIGPGGVVKPFPRPGEDARQKPPHKKVLTPEEKAAQIRKALAPKPSLAVVRRHTLNDLYGKLAIAKDADEAKGLATLIGSIWMRSGSDTANLLMQRAVTAIDKKDFPVALDLLDRLVALKPSWAEAWNKRASVRFYTKDYDGSMGDVEHVLKLEPKHFGALAGMATILQQTGFNKRALEVFRRSLAIYPHQPEVEKIVEKLTLEVEGQGI